MTKDEALKLALEVLKRIDEATPTAMAKLVIPEIEQVLAQPEHIGFMDSKLNPIERTWVGLTDKEILADDVLRYHFGLNGGAGPVSKSGRKIVDALEAKIKEKNT